MLTHTCTSYPCAKCNPTYHKEVVHDGGFKTPPFTKVEAEENPDSVAHIKKMLSGHS